MSVDRIKEEKDALTADAMAWNCLATAQRQLSGVVSDLGLRLEDLNPRADSKTSAHRQYSALMSELEQTLKDGSQVVADASQALIDVRNAYARNEQAADDLALQLIKEVDAWSVR